MRYILDCLVTLHSTIQQIGDETIVERKYASSYIEFEDAFQIFLGFKDPEFQYDIKNERKHFNELLCHPKHGLCINIVTIPRVGNEKAVKYIVLRPVIFIWNYFTEHYVVL